MGKPPPILLGLCMKSSASSQRAFHYLHAECWSIIDHANRAQISALELCTATCETGFYLSEQCYRLEAGPVGKALRRHLRSPRMPRLIRAVHRVMVLISRTKEGKRTFVDREDLWIFLASEQREDQWQHKTSYAHVFGSITSIFVPDSCKPRPTQPPFPQQTTRHLFGGEVALNFVVCAPT